MITYIGGSFGFNVLFRVHGSAVYKSLTPALLSSVVYLMLYRVVGFSYTESPPLFLNPYPITALVASYTFLLIFRANYSYNRWWEAYTAVYSMHSRWSDFAMDVASFHYQSHRYDAHRPPSFGAHPEVQSLSPNMAGAAAGPGGDSLSYELSRHHSNNSTNRHRHATVEDLIEQIDALEEEERQRREDAGRGGPPPSLRSRFRSFRQRRNGKSLTKILERRRKESNRPQNRRTASSNSTVPNCKSITSPVNRLHETIQFGDRFDKTTGKPYSIFTAVTRKHLRDGGLDPDETPPLLFLEECAHLLSLMSAVAFSTLRNDLPNAESPLADFQPGLPWPHVDPDSYRGEYRKGWARSKYRWYTVVRYLLGASRTDKSRTLYNAARPFRVIGNVSDNEIVALQEARGPLAKVSLVSMWLQELVSRESIRGSTGPIAPPIISRLYQYISDGMAGYNQARKIASIPFPFPHAQITTLFTSLICILVIPVLMLTFVTSEPVGFALNVATVMCFSGLHEVAREIENPFQVGPML
jgi:predicted membrane chloride channel (bestrophin family)